MGPVNLGDIPGGKPVRLSDENAGAVDIGLHFERCEQGDLLQPAFDLQKHYGLLANDAVVLAVAIRLEADYLVSSDKRFRPVEEVDVLASSDLRI